MASTRPASYSARADRARVEIQEQRRREMPRHLRRYPTMPASVSAEEREAWRVFRDAVEPFGIITAADFASVEGLIFWCAHVRRVRAALRARPVADLAACTLSAHLSTAERSLRRWFVVLGLTAAQIRHVWERFGLPLARAGVPEEKRDAR